MVSIAAWNPGRLKASEDAHTDNIPVSMAQGESRNDLEPDQNLGFLFSVFIVTWAGFFGYAFLMSRRQREVRREIDTIKALVEEQKESGKPS